MPQPKPTLSLTVVEFLLGVVYSIPLNATPDGQQALTLTLRARDELQAIIDAE